MSVASRGAVEGIGLVDSIMEVNEGVREFLRVKVMPPLNLALAFSSETPSPCSLSTEESRFSSTAGIAPAMVSEESAASCAA
jgi:hypothetical protein